MLSLGREIFGDGGGRQSGADARERRLVGSRYDYHRTRQTFLSDRAFQKLAHLAAAFTDQRQHGEIGRGSAGHHAHQRALAHPAAPEDAHALPASTGEHPVDGSDATAERFADTGARQRQRGLAPQRPVFASGIRTLGIERVSHAVDDSSEQSRPHAQAGTRAARDNAVAVADACGPFERHGENLLSAEAHDFTCQGAAVGGQDGAAFSHRTEWAFRFHQVVHHFGHPAHPAKGGEVIKAAKIRSQRTGRLHSGVPAGAARAGPESPARFL